MDEPLVLGLFWAALFSSSRSSSLKTLVPLVALPSHNNVACTVAATNTAARIIPRQGLNQHGHCIHAFRLMLPSFIYLWNRISVRFGNAKIMQGLRTVNRPFVLMTPSMPPGLK